MLHCQSGWYFTRTSDGGVLIRKHEMAREDAPLQFAIIVDPDSWASIVSSVCSRGETGPTFRAAREFHG